MTTSFCYLPKEWLNLGKIRQLYQGISLFEKGTHLNKINQSKGVSFNNGKLETMAENKPLNHISTSLLRKVKKKKTLSSLKWLILLSLSLSLTYQINVIRNASIPCKIASDPNLGWEETTGDLWEQARTLCVYIKQPLTVWNKPRKQRAKNSEYTFHPSSIEVKLFLGYLPIMLHG